MQKPLYELKENPLSRAIYGDETDVDDLAKSLKETTPLKWPAEEIWAAYKESRKGVAA